MKIAVTYENGQVFQHFGHTAQFKLYTIEDGKEEAYIYQSPLTVSLMVNGEESVMINHVMNTDRVSLPMSYTQERDTVIFRYDDGLCDSLYIDHTNTPYYQSMECGTLMFHKLEGLKSTNVWIEDAAIVNDIVNFEGDFLKCLP